MSVATSLLVATVYKDPNEVLDYQFDWGAEYLGADTIASSAWTSTPSGLTHVSTSVTGDDTEANIRIDGGLDGQDYTVTNHVVLDSGQEAERSFLLKVRDR